MREPIGAHDPVLPPAFDWTTYVKHGSNRDLAAFGQSEATHHYTAYGRKEGRVCSAIDGRAAFLRLVPRAGSLLEIGPSCTPCFSQQDRDVSFLDVFPTQELKEIVANYPWGKPEKVPTIDYVWRGEPYSDLVKRKFDSVFSSHTIEHQPCLITHLNDVASILKPGKRLFLIIPDRRYCFDYYLNDATIAAVLEAYRLGRRKHSPRSIIEHGLLLTHNETDAHWRGEHGPDPRERKPDANFLSGLRNVFERAAVETGYVDVHAWQFTPDSFSYLIGTLGAAGLIAFRVEVIYPTLRPNNEFFAVLQLVTNPQKGE